MKEVSNEVWEIAQDLYEDADFNINRYGEVESFTVMDFDDYDGYYRDCKKSDYEEAKAYLNELLNDVKYYEGNLELNDNRTLWDIEIPEGTEFNEEEYSFLYDQALEHLEEEIGEEVYGLGRSGRHICVADTFRNLTKLDTFKEAQEKWEKWLIDTVISSAKENGEAPIEEGLNKGEKKARCTSCGADIIYTNRDIEHDIDSDYIECPNCHSTFDVEYDAIAPLLNKKTESEKQDLYVYTDANSYDKQEVEGNIYNYKQEAPNLEFKVYKQDDMYYVEFIGTKEDLIDYLTKLNWYTKEEINDLDLLKPYNKNVKTESYEVWQKYYEDGEIARPEYVQSFDTFEKAQKFADGLNEDPNCEAWVEELKESKKVIEAEDNTYYEVKITLDGHTEELYNPYASNKKEAKNKALEMAKKDLYVSSVDKLEDGKYSVFVKLKEGNGSEIYEIEAETEEKAKEEALKQAYLDLKIIYNYRESKEIKTEAEDMKAVKDDVKSAVEKSDSTDMEKDQVKGSLDVLKTDEESAIDGYEEFNKETAKVVDKELADTIDDQMQEIVDDEKEHIEKLDTIKSALGEGLELDDEETKFINAMVTRSKSDIEDFLGYDLTDEQFDDKQGLRLAIKEIYEQMPDDEFNKFKSALGESKQSSKKLDYKLDGFKGVNIVVVDKKNNINAEEYLGFDSMKYGIDEWEFEADMKDGIKDILSNLYEYTDAYYDDVFTENEIDEIAGDITQDVLQLYDDLPDELIDFENGIANLSNMKSTLGESKKEETLGERERGYLTGEVEAIIDGITDLDKSQITGKLIDDVVDIVSDEKVDVESSEFDERVTSIVRNILDDGKKEELFNSSINLNVDAGDIASGNNLDLGGIGALAGLLASEEEKESDDKLQEAKDTFDKQELQAVSDSIDTALDDLQLTSNGTVGDMEDKVLRDELKGTEQTVDRYISRMKENKEVKTEANEGTIKEQLNTGLLPIVDVDLYSRYSAEMLNGVPEGEEGRLDEMIQEIAPMYIKEAIQNVLPSVEIYATGVYHPREYNFSGDELEFDLVVNKDEYEALKEKVLSDDSFVSFLKDNYKSYDGFISYMADNIDDFNKQDSWKQLVQVIMFALKDTDLQVIKDDYNDKFMETVWQEFPDVDDDELDENKKEELFNNSINLDVNANDIGSNNTLDLGGLGDLGGLLGMTEAKAIEMKKTENKEEVND